MVTLTAGLPAPTPVTLPATNNYDWQYTVVALTSAAGYAPVANTGHFALAAANPGLWGNTVQASGTGLLVQITPSSRTQSQILSISSVAPGTNNLLVLNSGANFYVGAILEVSTASAKIYAKVLVANQSSLQLVSNLAAAAVTDITTDLGVPVPVFVRTCEFDIAAFYGNVNESFRGLNARQHHSLLLRQGPDQRLEPSDPDHSAGNRSALRPGDARPPAPCRLRPTVGTCC